MVVLKRLADAEADGDRIWAVILGSAVNQNGASAGPTVPNGPAQEQAIEEALSRAGVPPAEVDYLEAHGAGSELGDPIELRAAAAVYGRGRETDRPLLIGSVKTNIGHLESAAGVAGLIKTVLAMKRGVIPKHLHFREPNPHLDWDRLSVRVTSEPTEWPRDPDRPPRAGVSAFGISGTNAHVVLEGYGAADAGPDDDGSPVGSRYAVSLPESVADLPPVEEVVRERENRLLPLSGKSDQALRELAQRYLSWLDERAGDSPDEDTPVQALLADMAWTAGVGRSHFDHRAGVVFRDAASLRDGLKKLADAAERPVAAATKVAFAYTGQGSRWVGMGQALYESEPVVRAVLDRCDAVLRETRSASLLDVMFGRAGSEEDLDAPAWMQLAVYALECALTALWSSVGIRPTVVVGQDLGELAAAQAAGVFGLEEGVAFGDGAGCAVGGVAWRTALRSPIRNALLDGIALAPPSLVLVSGVTGRTMETDDALDGAYWRRQGHEPAAFAECVKTLATTGGGRGGGDRPGGGCWLRRWSQRGRRRRTRTGITRRRWCCRASGATRASDNGFVEAVAGAYEAGLGVSFAGLFAGESRHRISLPGYPFERRRYWIEAPKWPTG